MKKAFTLIELLIVIGIIGVLSAILFTATSGSSDSARAAICQSNLRNLAAGCQSYAMAHGCYPLAGSVEKLKLEDGTTGNDAVKTIYREVTGWISWYSDGAYRSKPTSPKASASWNLSAYASQTEEARYYCLTNGALWKYVTGNRSIYCCPLHQKKMKKLNPNWSYVMNGAFGCTAKYGTDVFDDDEPQIGYKSLKRADRRLLFAELQFIDDSHLAVKAKTTTSAGPACDCTLQYKDLDGFSENESIGVNHKIGKEWYANVCFADGHTEKLLYPNNMSEADLQNLTKWLCRGKDVSFDGKKYKNLMQDDD